MAHDARLADRLRAALHAQRPGAVREVKMFGGLSFMVNEKLAVGAANGGGLLVRCAPDRVDELLEQPGASWAEMRGKPMSRGWLRVSAEAVQDAAALDLWVTAALAHSRAETGAAVEDR